MKECTSFPFNLTKSPVLVQVEYIYYTIPAYSTYNWHLTNLHARASKGNKIMRKLQGKWVLVPHGELKLIICDNLSASENSNMSTKLCEPQKGVEKRKRKKKNDKRKKGKEKRKGQLETSFFLHGKKRLPRSRLSSKCFRRLWFDKLDLNVQYSRIIFFFRSYVCLVFGVNRELGFTSFTKWL